MSSATPPFPPSGTFIQSVRESSRLLRESTYVVIDSDAVRRLLLSPAFTTTFQRVSAYHGLVFPLKFPSVLAELNFLSILSLLNFASGYRIPLHQQVGRGAWDSIRALVFSLYLASSGEGNLLSAKGMRTLDEQKVAHLMQIDIFVEKAHDTIPGVTVGQLGGPMHELVSLIAGILKETGDILVGLGYPDLGSFVLEALKEASNTNGGLDADVVLERLVRAIPGFQDMAIVEGLPIYCFKKALFLIHAITIRFGSGSSSAVPVCETSRLPVFTDNVLPSLLIHLGVIDISNTSLVSLFPNSKENLYSLLAPPKPEANLSMLKDGPVLSAEQAYILRAAAIDACETIVQVARTLDITHPPDAENLEWIRRITLPELDMWLWAVAKDRDDYRQLPRFVFRETVFF